MHFIGASLAASPPVVGKTGQKQRRLPWDGTNDPSYVAPTAFARKFP
jgi:hypothetical protein